MVKFDVEPVNLHEIQGRLGNVWQKAPNIMAKAINISINDLRDLLLKRIQEVYTIKTSGFRKAWRKNKVVKANPSKLEATINVKGKRLSFVDFILNPSKRPKKQPDYYRGKFLVKSSLKEMVANNGNKGFIAKMPNGHTGIFYRISKSYENRKLAEITAPSIPQMAKDEENVYGVVEPKINEALNKNINKLIERELKKK